MEHAVDNSGETDYGGKIADVATTLAGWDGPVVLIAHVDPDGDALGSTLAMKRALDALGKQTVLAIEPPAYLTFLTRPDETRGALDALPQGTLVCVLDVADRHRAWGAPLEQAAFTVNLDHHGTNERFGDLALVEPRAAATALIVKDVIDALPVAWTEPMATPCLTGILTDTGTFRFANTDRAVLSAAGELIEHGVDYPALADRLQWRPQGYFRLLAAVMGTVRFPLAGRAALAHLTESMKEGLGAVDDGDDFVGLIRYAEGAYVAALLKQKEDAVKVSVRARAPVSAQAICMELGGGGHVAAAGAKFSGPDLAAAEAQLVAAIERELGRHDLA